MEKITFKNNLINWRNFKNTEVLNIEKLSDENIHIELNGVGTILFIINDTELNGLVYANSDELIAELNK